MVTFVVSVKNYLIPLIPQKHPSLMFICRRVFLPQCIFYLSQPLSASSVTSQLHRFQLGSTSRIFCNTAEYLNNATVNSNNKRMFLFSTTFSGLLLSGPPCINRLKSNKSCGLDGIETKFVKIAEEIIALVLINLYYQCFALGVFPSCLKTAKVIPVFKSGKFQ